jgi:hypothetical protein
MIRELQLRPARVDYLCPGKCKYHYVVRSGPSRSVCVSCPVTGLTELSAPSIIHIGFTSTLGASIEDLRSIDHPSADRPRMVGSSQG